MVLNSIFAFLHFLVAFGVVTTVLYERIAFKQTISNKEASRIQEVDKFYGISSILVLIIGFLRVYFFEKGADFYFSNPFFWVKIGLFTLVGLLSIYPTIRFIKWRKLIQDGKDIELSTTEYKRINLILNLEVLVLVLLVLSASLMAKGISF